jgi:hypothetical protein
MGEWLIRQPADAEPSPVMMNKEIGEVGEWLKPTVC